MKHITEVMQSADSALHLHQIVSKSKQPEHVVRAFIREQSAFGNIDVVPTRGRYGNRYEWVGPLAIKEEMLEIEKEVDAESIDEAQPHSAAEELEQPKEPEPIKTIELARAIKPLPEAKEPEMTQPVTTVAPKVRYLIQAAKDKMATANSEKSAKQIAKRFVKEGHKRVEISTIYPYAVAKSGIEVERVW